jgi:[protein-PII] uridylyltransferase
MAEISQRRDLESDEEIQAFARLVGNVETLDMLTLLTFCDSMGTSRDLWTGFKDSLLWTLYDRTRQWLNGQTEPRVALEQAKREFSLSLRQRVRQSIPDDEIQAHLNHMPDRYFRNRLLEHMVEDVHLTHRFMWRQISKQDRALEPIVHWRHDRDRGFSMVDLVTWDRPAIFCKFTGALAAAGLNILSARIFSRSDGIVLDSFEVVDAGSGELVRKFKRDKFSTIIKKVLGEAADLDALVEKQIQTPPLYQMIEPEPFADRVRFDNQRLPSRTVLEVETQDRVGLLYRISKVLNRLELDLSYAKILTEKGAAVDTFYLKNAQGSKITEAAEQETIRKALLQELKPKSTQSPRA